MNDVYAIKNGFHEEVRLYDLYYLSLFYGLFRIEKVDDLSCLSIFGFNFFERIDCISVLFGVNWNGN